jgi:hypothetical protein
MKIPIDKQYHFIAGFCIYTVAQLYLPVWAALIPVIIIASAKEVYDYVSNKGNPEINDLLFTIYGALPVFILRLILEELIKK